MGLRQEHSFVLLPQHMKSTIIDDVKIYRQFYGTVDDMLEDLGLTTVLEFDYDVTNLEFLDEFSFADGERTVRLVFWVGDDDVTFELRHQNWKDARALLRAAEEGELLLVGSNGSEKLIELNGVAAWNLENNSWNLLEARRERF